MDQTNSRENHDDSGVFHRFVKIWNPLHYKSFHTYTQWSISLHPPEPTVISLMWPYLICCFNLSKFQSTSRNFKGMNPLFYSLPTYRYGYYPPMYAPHMIYGQQPLVPIFYPQPFIAPTSTTPPNPPPSHDNPPILPVEIPIIPTQNNPIIKEKRTPKPTAASRELSHTHRSSCHTCGNVRIKKVPCTRCPYIFCTSCVLKMKAQYGEEIFTHGCPVCERVCCCSNRTKASCSHPVHCYKKCLKRRFSEMSRASSSRDGMAVFIFIYTHTDRRFMLYKYVL